MTILGTTGISALPGSRGQGHVVARMTCESEEVAQSWKSKEVIISKPLLRIIVVIRPLELHGGDV